MPNNEAVQYLEIYFPGFYLYFRVWIRQSINRLRLPKLHNSIRLPDQHNQLVDQAKALGIDTTGMTERQLKQAIGAKSGHNP